MPAVKRWRMREGSGETELVDAGVEPLLARLLSNRGIADPEAASKFLTGALADIRSPLLMKGMAEAVARLAEARRKGEHVLVSGDYDVDGITSVALLVTFFRAVGIACSYYIPHRLEEGYGFGEGAVRTAAASGASVIITVDCGITAVAEARMCATAGIDLIVTDHHIPGPALPEALAVIDPHLPGCLYPFKGLAGVGVAFNIAMALREHLRREGGFAGEREPNLREYLDLVALGTIADVVPLVEENRLFVRYGLKELTAARRVGIAALKSVAGINGEVDCGMVGFRLAPRLNACGRLEDAALGVELLLCDDPERARAIASELDAANAARQAVEQEILSDALAKVRGDRGLKGRKTIVLASEEWHPGVIGIVASRIVDLYHRPTILIALKDGNGRGSGRSIAAFHLHDALSACSDHLAAFGGHRHAAGLSIEEGMLETFVENFEEVAAGLLSPDDLVPEVPLDADLTGKEVTAETATLCARLSPFGLGNPEPSFMVRRARVLRRRVLGERHLKLSLDAGGTCVDAIGFGMGDRSFGDVVDLVFSPQLNEWNGKTSLQFRIRDLREPAEGA
jgi:single-stranded-DNA-specific exonuclease